MAEYKDLLAIEKARYGQRSDSGLTNDAEITLVFRGIPITALEGSKNWARLNRRRLENPVIEYKTVEGVWRSVRVTTSNQKGEGVLEHVFRLGLAQAFSTDECRITGGSQAASDGTLVPGVAASQSDNPNKVLVLSMPNCDPRYTETILSGIPGTYSNPEIESNTIGGTYAVIAKSYQRDEDGSVTVSLMLSSEVLTLAAFDDYLTSTASDVYYLYRIPIAVAQSILTAHKATKGNSASVLAFSDQDRTCTLLLAKANVTSTTLLAQISRYQCSLIETTDQYNGIESGSAYPVTDHTEYGNEGWSFDRSSRENRNGTFDIEVRATHTLTRNIDAQKVLQDANQDLTRTFRLGLAGTDELTSDDDLVPVQGSVYNRDFRVNPDCSVDETIDQRDSKELGIEFTSLVNPFRRQVAIDYKAARSLMTVPELPGGLGQYGLSQQVNGDYTYDYRLTFDVATEDEFEAVHQSAYSSVERSDRLFRVNSPSLIEAPDAPRGFVTSARSSINDLGYYDGEYTVREARSASFQFASQETITDKSYATRILNSESMIAGPEFEAGKVVSTQSTLNEFGYYDGGYEEREAKSAEFEHVVSGNAFESRTRKITINSEEYDNADSFSAGVIVEAQSSLNQFGYYDTEEVTRTARSDEFIEQAAGNINTDAIRRSKINSNTVIGTGISIDYGRFRARSSFNQFGYYDGDYEYEYGKPTEFTFVAVNGKAHGGEYAEVTVKTALTEIDALEANTNNNVKRRRISLTDFGYDETLEAITTEAVAFGPYVSRRLGGVTEYSYTYLNWEASLDVPSGQRGRSVFDPNREDGTWNGNLTISFGGGATTTAWDADGPEIFYAGQTQYNSNDYHVYVYDEFTSSRNTATEHTEYGPYASQAVVAQAGGKSTDIVPIGRGRMRARRVEIRLVV